MSTLLCRLPPLSLLVSVRSAEEAAAALTGGADIIDVKEPARGPLGRADAGVVRGVVDLAAGLRPVTAAAGDLGDLGPREFAAWAIGSAACLVKLGVVSTPTAETHALLATMRQALPPGVGLAPALYADRLAEPPGVQQLADLADAAGARWLVVDTADKSGPPLTALWGREELSNLVRDATGAGLRLVIAGGIALPDVSGLSGLRPAALGFRGAVCRGGREGRVCAQLVSRIAYAANAAPH